MVRLIAALSLIVSLVLPHIVSAEPGAHVHDHHGMVAEKAEAAHTCKDGQCEERSVLICCEMLAGHCSTLMLQPGAATALSLDQKSSAAWPVGTCRIDGLSLAFDPPPPRV